MRRAAPLLCVVAACHGEAHVARGPSATEPHASSDAGVETSFGPAAPIEAIDPTLARPSSLYLVGATATRALLRGASGDATFYAELDLARGCVRGTRPTFAAARELEALDRDAYERRADAGAIAARRAEALSRLAAPETRRELDALVALASAAGATEARPFAWPASGAHIAATIAGGLFVSWDHAPALTPVDAAQASSPVFTRSGSALFYERCARPDAPYHCPDEHREVAALARGATAPVIARVGSAQVAGLSATGDSLLLTREGEGERLCVDALRATGALERVYCVDGRVEKAGAPPQIAVSPRGTWAAFDSRGERRSRLFVFDLRTGAKGHTLDDVDAAQVEVDDRGLVAWEAPDTRHAIVKSAKTRRDLGPGKPLGWTPDGALLVWRPDAGAATLAEAPCALLRVEAAAP